jgi:hypothetical protein
LPPRLRSPRRELQQPASRCSLARWQSAPPRAPRPAMPGSRDWAASRSQRAGLSRSPCRSDARRSAGLLPASKKAQAKMQDCPMCSKFQSPFKTGHEPGETRSRRSLGLRMRRPVPVERRRCLQIEEKNVRGKIHARPEPSRRQPCKQQSDFFAARAARRASHRKRPAFAMLSLTPTWPQDATSYSCNYHAAGCMSLAS